MEDKQSLHFIYLEPAGYVYFQKKILYIWFLSFLLLLIPKYWGTEEEEKSKKMSVCG
jgi:hypothetical protein